MGKFFLVTLYLYTAWHIFAFGGRTVEITQDDMGNRIQQVYDRYGNITDVYDETGQKLKETSYSSDGEIMDERIYENGRLVKETEYDPYLDPVVMASYIGRTEQKEYKYTPDATQVEIIFTVQEGHVVIADSVTCNMQSPDNYVSVLAYSIYGTAQNGNFVAQIDSVMEYGPDYHIETRFNSDGTVHIFDSREES